MTEKKVILDVEAWVKAWSKLSPEEQKQVADEAEKRMVRDLAGVDDDTDERLGF